MSAPAPDAAAPSQAFDLLHEGVKRWIWRQGWSELRDIQERAIPALLTPGRDLIIAAATASGKTEAAFLPIVSNLATAARAPGEGFDALYISPLRALINDQFGRIEGLCEDLAIPVVKWHGDVGAGVKAQARRRPGGVLLTTPESLEAMLMRLGPEVARLFAALTYVVIDELHAFLDAPRGRQLQSLLHRLDTATGRRPVRVGLSATLADMGYSADFLRPRAERPAEVLASAAGSQELQLQLRGYVPPEAVPSAAREPAKEEEAVTDAPAFRAIVEHLFATLRNGRSLIFAGSRQRVEEVTVALGALTEAAGVPEEFFAHHGNLSREHREEAERRMKDTARAAGIVCTTTLELGIDIGHIDAVAQIGPGHTVSGMRQRLGRSGRRPGRPAVMRLYVQEAALGPSSHPLDRLRVETVQATAMVNLMLKRWNEPPGRGRLHLSTLQHQILALIAQHGGVTAGQAWTQLVESGVFPEIDLALFKAVLQCMGGADVGLLEQAPDGLLLPGPEGERILASRDAYAVFMTPVEFAVVTDRGRRLGTVPVDVPYTRGQLLILAGRRWRVLEIDPRHREIIVCPAFGGRPPRFGGGRAPPAEAVIMEMRRIYEAGEAPRYLDAMASELLTEGCATFSRLGLATRRIAHHGDQLLLFPWVGAPTYTALLLSLVARDLKPQSSSLAISVEQGHVEDLAAALRDIAASPEPDGADLARHLPDLQRAKFDPYLSCDLLARCYASEHIETGRLTQTAKQLLADLEQG